MRKVMGVSGRGVCVSVGAEDGLLKKQSPEENKSGFSRSFRSLKNDGKGTRDVYRRMFSQYLKSVEWLTSFTLGGFVLILYSFCCFIYSFVWFLSFFISLCICLEFFFSLSVFKKDGCGRAFL